MLTIKHSGFRTCNVECPFVCTWSMESTSLTLWSVSGIQNCWSAYVQGAMTLLTIHYCLCPCQRMSGWPGAPGNMRPFYSYHHNLLWKGPVSSNYLILYFIPWTSITQSFSANNSLSFKGWRSTIRLVVGFYKQANMKDPSGWLYYMTLHLFPAMQVWDCDATLSKCCPIGGTCLQTPDRRWWLMPGLI